MQRKKGKIGSNITAFKGGDRMTGKELYEVINEALKKLNAFEMDDADLYFSKDEFQNYTCDDIMKMLKKNKRGEIS